MKINFRYILVVFLILMFLITCLFCYKEGVVLRMLNGSIESTTKYFTVTWLIPLLLCLACMISLSAYLKRKRYSAFLFWAFLFIWVLSGRTIGLHHTGELSIGWFYFETNKVVLWERGKCEGNVLESTTFRKEFPFMLRYENQCVNDQVYVGPFLVMDVKY